MKTYIRFENGKQVEVTTLESKPLGTDWKTTPKNFDFTKRYRLSVSGSVEEMPQEIVDKERLTEQKSVALLELSRIIDRSRAQYVGETPYKQKSYEIQEKIASTVIDNPETSLGLIIKPLADVRNISVSDMADLILEKSTLANKKIIEAEAIEDKYQDLIESAESISRLDELLSEVSIQLEEGHLPEVEPLPEDF